MIRFQGRSVPCYPKLNLLGHAQIEEIETGSQCGGHGICGKDRWRVRVLAGALSPVTEIEREHLSDEEISAGFRLLCQTFPESEETEVECER